MKKKLILIVLLTFLYKSNQAQTVTDIDGNIYNTVVIGTQVWMKENLKTTHYSNGDSLPFIIDTGQWSNLIIGSYCNYNHSESIGDIYGRLYNWYAVSDFRNLCPTGWHTPADSEWYTLESYLGGELNAGGKMKETGTLHWISPNNLATNTSGFTALPGGARYGDEFWLIGYEGNFWSSTSTSVPSAAIRTLKNTNSTIIRSMKSKLNGYSVRCINDTIASRIDDYNFENKIKLYPNPVINILNIETPEVSTIEVLDIKGQLLRTCHTAGTKTSLDISDLLPGIYFIVLTTNDGNLFNKIIKY